MTNQRHARILHWDDERAEGNSLIVTLKHGWEFDTDPLEARHVEGFDTVKEAMAAVRSAIPCQCRDCLAHK